MDTYLELFILQLVDPKKYFLSRLLWIDYIKPKDAPMIWCGNNFENRFNEMNHGWMIFHSTESWQGLNWISQYIATS